MYTHITCIRIFHSYIHHVTCIPAYHIFIQNICVYRYIFMQNICVYIYTCAAQTSCTAALTTHCNRLQQTATRFKLTETHCNTPQHPATHCNTPHHDATPRPNFTAARAAHVYVNIYKGALQRISIQEDTLHHICVALATLIYLCVYTREHGKRD